MEKLLVVSVAVLTLRLVPGGSFFSSSSATVTGFGGGADGALDLQPSIASLSNYTHRILMMQATRSYKGRLTRENLRAV